MLRLNTARKIDLIKSALPLVHPQLRSMQVQSDDKKEVTIRLRHFVIDDATGKIMDLELGTDASKLRKEKPIPNKPVDPARQLANGERDDDVPGHVTDQSRIRILTIKIELTRRLNSRLSLDHENRERQKRSRLFV